RGRGAVTAGASDLVTRLAERLGAPVVTTWMGKGAIDETHLLNAWSVGDTASTSGNGLAAAADVLVAVGCRFTDWSSSSWRRGVTFAIPPTRLIQIEIDPREIGKNYPAEVGLLGDAREALVDLLDALGPAGGRGERAAAVDREAELGDPYAADASHQRRLLHHGLHCPGGNRGEARKTRPAGHRDRRRWRLPPDDAGAGHRGDARHPHRVHRAEQQRLD